MGVQDNATSAGDAEIAIHIIWVKEDGCLQMASLESLNGKAQQRLAQQGVFARVEGTNGKNYILMGKADSERGFAVVDYDTIRAVSWIFTGMHVVHPSRRKYAATYTADGLWEIMDYDLECHAPDEGPWTAASARRKPARRPAGRVVSAPGLEVGTNRYSLLQDGNAGLARELANHNRELPDQPHQHRAGSDTPVKGRGVAVGVGPEMQVPEKGSLVDALMRSAVIELAVQTKVISKLSFDRLGFNGKK